MTIFNNAFPPELFRGGERHVVQFYENDDYLLDLVAHFFADGLVGGEAIVAIATPEHRAGIASRLKQKGFVLGESIRLLDARTTLDAFMDGAMPDEQRFREVVGGVLRQCTALAPNRGIRAYGEMVDLLWREGNGEAAIRLEELWNGIADEHTFSLLCSYPLGNFYRESDSRAFEDICRRHTHALPTESYTAADETERMVEVSLLQQRALSAHHRAEETVRRAADDSAFLLEAAEVLHRSLEFETRARDLAELVVPRLADWCAVDVVRDDTTLHRLGVAGEPPATRTDDGTSISVPMTLGERFLGVLSFGARSRRYDDVDLKLATELAHRAAVAIENARLFEVAARANRAKDDFLATLSHELRTPLTAILGWARMMTLGTLDAETTRVAVETIERSARTQASLIDDLLDLSKVVTGKLTLQNELVDLAVAVENAVKTQQLAAEAKQIHLDVSIASGRIVVNGDPTRLQQIVWNLLSNAIKFSGRGDRVSLSVERHRDLARVTVSDTGHGIAREFLPYVFEPFRQADGATTRMHGGLGLGLAIVKRLVELHGGSVSATSEGEGKGATFVVTLPLVARRAAQAQPVTEEVADLSGTSILLVDDDADTRAVVMAILRRSGASVESAESVKHACRMLEIRHPDVIVTDIAMPGYDGFALLDYVRSRETSRDIPVIALTAFGQAEVQDRLIGAGFRAYVRKPVDPHRFTRAIAELRM